MEVLPHRFHDSVLHSAHENIKHDNMNNKESFSFFSSPSYTNNNNNYIAPISLKRVPNDDHASTAVDKHTRNHSNSQNNNDTTASPSSSPPSMSHMRFRRRKVRIGEWDVDACIGSGSYARVYLAHHHITQQQVSPYFIRQRR